MDTEFFNLLFKTCLLAMVSFFAPFVVGVVIIMPYKKKEWIVLSLFSFVIMVVSLLIFGIIITK